MMGLVPLQKGKRHKIFLYDVKIQREGGYLPASPQGTESASALISDFPASEL